MAKTELSDIEALNRIVSILDGRLGFVDAFGKAIADNTTNDLDIGGHYPYNQERLRLFVNGARVFPEYGSVSQYNHAVDVHELTPAAGETVTLESMERPRYTVQYEVVPSFAFNINQSLQTGDIIRVGKYDDNDGWYLEHNDSHADNECDLVIRRNGSVDESVNVNDLHEPFTTWCRYASMINWYGVGNALWTQFYITSKFYEYVKKIGRVGVENGRGPRVGNLPLRYEVTAGGSTTGLKLNAGSMAHITLGNATSKARTKTTPIVTSHGGSSGYVPIAALRVDPNRYMVVTDLLKLTLQKVSENTDVTLIAIAVDPSNTDASGFSTPPEDSPDSNVIEQTISVTTMPDSSGNNVTNAANPGGYKLAYSSLYTTGTGAGTYVSKSNIDDKSVINENDIIIIAADTGNTAVSTIKLEHTTKQIW